MKEEPKKIWLDSDGAAWEHYSEEDTLYIRADIVDELVEALEDHKFFPFRHWID